MGYTLKRNLLKFNFLLKLICLERYCLSQLLYSNWIGRGLLLWQVGLIANVKLHFLAMFHQPIKKLNPSSSWSRIRCQIEKEVRMREARFIYISDSRIYHLLPIGNNFSIDKSGMSTRASDIIRTITRSVCIGYW